MVVQRGLSRTVRGLDDSDRDLALEVAVAKAGGPSYNSSGYSRAAGVSGVPSGRFAAPVISTRTAPSLSPSAARVQGGAPVDPRTGFDSSAYAGAANMFANTGMTGVRGPRVPVSTGTFGGYTEDDANRFIAAIQAGGGAGLGGDMLQKSWTAEGENRLLDYLAAAGLDMTEREQDRIAAAMGGGGGGGGGGGAAGPSYDLTALTNYVNEQLANLGTQYGGYGTQLEEQRAAAAQRIADANAAALARMQTVDPMSQFNYNVDIEALPMAAGTDYLSRIGASTADVDAARALGRQLVNAQIGAGRTFAQQIADAQAADRAARIAAVESAGLQGVSGLESTAAAMQERIRLAQLAEERRLQELLLEAQLKYGVA